MAKIFSTLAWPPYRLVTHLVYFPGLNIGQFVAKCLGLYLCQRIAKILTIASAFLSVIGSLCVQGCTCANVSARVQSSNKPSHCQVYRSLSRLLALLAFSPACPPVSKSFQSAVSRYMSWPLMVESCQPAYGLMPQLSLLKCLTNDLGIYLCMCQLVSTPVPRARHSPM